MSLLQNQGSGPTAQQVEPANPTAAPWSPWQHPELQLSRGDHRHLNHNAVVLDGVLHEKKRSYRSALAPNIIGTIALNLMWTMDEMGGSQTSVGFRLKTQIARPHPRISDSAWLGGG